MKEFNTDTPLQAIRMYCFECSGSDKAEVKLCPQTWCPLYKYRFGKNTNIKEKHSEEMQNNPEKHNFFVGFSNTTFEVGNSSTDTEQV